MGLFNLAEPIPHTPHFSFDHSLHCRPKVELLSGNDVRFVRRLVVRLSNMVFLLGEPQPEGTISSELVLSGSKWGTVLLGRGMEADADSSSNMHLSTRLVRLESLMAFFWALSRLA